MKMFRMFEEKDGLPHTLFHGVSGRRKLPLDSWIESRTALVRDGSSGTEYTSGFHVLPTADAIISFLNRFRKLENRVICEVEIDKQARIWPKAHSPADVFLAKKMKISSNAWDRRINCKTLR